MLDVSRLSGQPFEVQIALIVYAVLILLAHLCSSLVSYKLVPEVQAASARDFLNAGALEAAPRGRDLLNYLKACVF